MKTRRDFLKAIAAIAAAVSTTDITELLAAPSSVPQVLPDFKPVVDWSAWNHIELTHVRGHLTGFINDAEVTAFPDLMQQICRLISIDPEKGAVSFGNLLTHTVPELDTETPLRVGASVKFEYRPHEGDDGSGSLVCKRPVDC